MDEPTTAADLDVQAVDHPEPILSLTPLASEMAKSAMEREGLTDAGLRVAVVGGGCSGFQYSLSFETAARADDTVLEQHGVRLFVDSTSLPYLRGMTIDYVTGLHGAGFKFVNPNATRTCGCGSSFAV
ncbi:MAG TPA: iron-sulfur cluster insertion protein ErpA [Candidatus Margulisiibacteriota bacterium]|nr:iron-sulfur cluster insertion protein ErpA [Candidatus Margulisiibacteriota bacterium]